MYLPGPVVLWRLAKMGAQVIRIESESGDGLERFLPELYDKLSEGQKIVRLDLRQKEKWEPFLKDADILISSLRPRSLERLGLTSDAMKERFPNLSYLSIVGFGGKDENWSGHDLTYQASKGFVSPPQLPFNCWSDMAGAQEAIIQALLLIHCAQNGKPGTAQVSLSDSLDFFALPMDYGLVGSQGILASDIPVYQVYEAKEGWVAIATLEPHFQEKFKEKADVSDMTSDTLKELFTKKSADEWENWAKAHDLPVAKVRTRPELK